jgi:hypothetical protein
MSLGIMIASCMSNCLTRSIKQHMMQPLLKKMSAISLEEKLPSSILPLELWIVSPLVTPNLNSKEAVASDRFLASFLPVLRFAFARVAISLAMSSSDQRVPTPGNMASNLVMVNVGGVIILEAESTEAGVDKPDETWEWLLT